MGSKSTGSSSGSCVHSTTCYTDQDLVDRATQCIWRRTRQVGTGYSLERPRHWYDLESVYHLAFATRPLCLRLQIRLRTREKEGWTWSWPSWKNLEAVQWHPLVLARTIKSPSQQTSDWCRESFEPVKEADQGSASRIRASSTQSRPVQWWTECKRTGSAGSWSGEWVFKAKRSVSRER